MNPRPGHPTWLIGLMVAGIVIALLGTAVLYSQLAKVAGSNARLICALGTAIAQTKVEQRAEENLHEFKVRVQKTRKFAKLLSNLSECDPPIPTGVKLKPEDRERLQQAEAAASEPDRSGGDASSNPPPGNSPPGPPPTDGGGPPPPPVPNPPNPPEVPPTPDGPVDGLLDEVCEVTGPLGVCLD